jgi:hypothetical protein
MDFRTGLTKVIRKIFLILELKPVEYRQKIMPDHGGTKVSSIWDSCILP